MTRRLALIPAACAALALTACSTDQDDTPAITETVTIEKDSTESTTATSSASSITDDSKDNGNDSANSEDPAFAAIEAALGAHANGIITDVDREGASFNIDLVEGQDHVEVTVDDKGTVTETERDKNEDTDNLTEAEAATVTAREAGKKALAQHSSAVIDSISLDEENGSLEWDIDLDDKDGNDLTEVTVPAT